MHRLSDTIGVLLFVAATAFVGVHTRGGLGDETPTALRTTEPPELTETTTSTASFRQRVESALPDLERIVVAGAQQDREDLAACLRDERVRVARLDAIERELLATIPPEDEDVREPLADALHATRACIACTSPRTGCAAAARAFMKVESALGLSRSAGGT